MIECFYSKNPKQKIIQNLVFEFIPKDLKYLHDYHKKNHKRIPIERIKKICFQIFRGLKALKERKILHRDMKLENILVDKQDNIKICDFGAAKFYDKNQKSSPYVVS